MARGCLLLFTRTTFFIELLTCIYTISFVSQFSPVSEIHKLKLKSKNVEINFNNFNNFPLSDFNHFWRTSIFDHRYPFVKTDSALSD